MLMREDDKVKEQLVKSGKSAGLTQRGQGGVWDFPKGANDYLEYFAKACYTRVEAEPSELMNFEPEGRCSL